MKCSSKSPEYLIKRYLQKFDIVLIKAFGVLCLTKVGNILAAAWSVFAPFYPRRKDQSE